MQGYLHNAKNTASLFSQIVQKLHLLGLFGLDKHFGEMLKDVFIYDYLCIFTGMAKRLLSILLFFLYLIPSIGISGSIHYCGDEVAAIILIPTDEHPCPCGPSEPMDDACCDDKSFSIKIQDTYKNTDSKVLFAELGDMALTHTTYWILNSAMSRLEGKAQFRIREKEPPDQKLYILHESYLI